MEQPLTLIEKERLTRENANNYINYQVRFTYNKNKYTRRIQKVNLSGVKIDFQPLGNNVLYTRDLMVMI
jgi:hypothetical protein